MIGHFTQHSRRLTLLSNVCRFQSTNSLSKTSKMGRTRLIEGWHAPRSGTLLNIEVAREEDRSLVLKFMNEQTRVQEPIISSVAAQAGEISTVFHGIIGRSVDSGLALLMFKEENDELIGIRMTSLADMPREPVTGEFKLLPDYKDLIDQQPGDSRKDKQVSALCEIAYGFGPKFLPPDCKQYFCMELIGIKPQYRLNGLATKFCQELFKLASSKGLRYGEVLCTAKASQRVCQKLGMEVKLEIDYEKFLDDGQVCFKDTNDGSTSAQLLVGDLKHLGYY